MVLFINVEKNDGHVSTLFGAQCSRSHENEALPSDRDVLLAQPEEEPKTISTLWQASTSTHRATESGGSRAFYIEGIHLPVCGQDYIRTCI